MAKNTNKLPSLPLPGQRLSPSGLGGRFIIKPNGDQMNALLLILHLILISTPPSMDHNSAMTETQFVVVSEMVIWTKPIEIVVGGLNGRSPQFAFYKI